MKEIKFRAWDKKNNRWYETELKFYGFTLFGECTLMCPPRIEDLQNLEITQFTGLKDKNGNEIYEGDICEWTDQHGLQKWPLEFLDARYGFWIGTPTDAVWVPLAEICVTDCELKVIGNIYESPVLIKS
jgi:uncharacterized phage protein (TIGR01671 family)